MRYLETVTLGLAVAVYAFLLLDAGVSKPPIVAPAPIEDVAFDPELDEQIRLHHQQQRHWESEEMLREGEERISAAASERRQKN